MEKFKFFGINVDNLGSVQEILNSNNDEIAPENYPRFVQIIDRLSASDLRIVLLDEARFLISLLSEPRYANEIGQKLIRSLETPTDAFYFYHKNSNLIEYLPQDQILALIRKLSMLKSTQPKFICTLGKNTLELFDHDTSIFDGNVNKIAILSEMEKLFGHDYKSEIDKCDDRYDHFLESIQTQPKPSGQKNSASQSIQLNSKVNVINNFCSLADLTQHIHENLILQQRDDPKAGAASFFTDNNGCLITLILMPQVQKSKKKYVKVALLLKILVSTKTGPVPGFNVLIPAGVDFGVDILRSQLNRSGVVNIFQL